MLIAPNLSAILRYTSHLTEHFSDDLQGKLSTCIAECLESYFQENPLNGFDDLYHLMSTKQRTHQQEMFSALLIDGYNQLMAFEDIFDEPISDVDKDCELIMQCLTAIKPAAVIFVHYYPKDATLTNIDDQVFSRLKESVQNLELTLINYFVLKDNGYSLVKEGIGLNKY